MLRSAKVRVQIAEEGGKIRMSFEDYRFVVTFNEKTGASGNKAYEKLTRILDAEQAKRTDDG